MKRAKKLKYHSKRRRPYSCRYMKEHANGDTEYGSIILLTAKEVKDILSAAELHDRTFIVLYNKNSGPTWRVHGVLTRPIKKFRIPQGAEITIMR